MLDLTPGARENLVMFLSDSVFDYILQDNTHATTPNGNSDDAV